MKIDFFSYSQIHAEKERTAHVSKYCILYIIYTNTYTSHKIIGAFHKWSFMISTWMLFFFFGFWLINNSKLTQLFTHLRLLSCIKYRNTIMTRNVIKPEKYTDLFFKKKKIIIIQLCLPRFQITVDTQALENGHGMRNSEQSTDVRCLLLVQSCVSALIL